MENTNAPATDVARVERWVGRQTLRAVTTDIRCYDCGREPVGQAVGLRLSAEGVTGYAGLASCGRIWLCPVCNAKVMAQRALEIAVALSWAEAEGLHVLFGALTVRHNANSDLEDLLELQRRAWDSVVSGRRWRSGSATTTVPADHRPTCSSDCDVKHRRSVDTGGPGRVGYIRAAEITIGRNGWHPHFHPIVLVRGSKREAQRVAESIVTEWVHGVEAAGGEARSVGGQMMKVLPPAVAFENIVGYVTKQTYSRTQRLALEAVWSQGKKSRGRAHSTAPHWSILEELARGEFAQIGRWDELEAAVEGHRMITWSRGLRDFAAVGVEAEDADIAACEVGTADDTVCFITPTGWEAIRDEPVQLTGYLDLLRSSGWAAVRAQLVADSVDFFELETASL